MKSPLLLALRCAFSLALLVAPVVAHAGANEVSLTVQDNRTTDEDKKKKTTDHYSTLQIQLRNVSRTAYDNLKVKWYIFAHDIGKNDATVLLSGEETTSLKPMDTVKIESKKATATSKDSVKDKKSGYTPASGQKLAGYGVQVFKDDKVIAETFLPEQNKAKVSQ